MEKEKSPVLADQMFEFMEKVRKHRIDGDSLAAFLAGDISGTHNMAYDYLRDNFLRGDNVASASGLPYSYFQAVSLAEKMPSKKKLEYCKQQGFGLIAGPAKNLSIRDIIKIFPKNIKGSRKSLESYGILDCTDVAGAEWIVARNIIRPGSKYSTWENQTRSLKEPERPITAPEAMWEILMRALIKLDETIAFEGIIRTASTVEDGHHITVESDWPGKISLGLSDPNCPELGVGILTVLDFWA